MKKLGIFIYIAVISFVLLSWFFYPQVIGYFLSKNGELSNLEHKGQFGDIYGGLNAIFSGIAMGSAFLVIWIGNKERNARQFEGHFFQQLESIERIIEGFRLIPDNVFEKLTSNNDTENSNNNVVTYRIGTDKFKIKIPDNNCHGRQVLLVLREGFKPELVSKQPNIKGNSAKYEKFYEEILHRVLGHYFRAVYTLIKYTNENKFLSNDEKVFYVHLVRARLSSDELFFLFYSGISKFGENKFKPLIEKYGLFEHLHNEFTSTDLIKYDKTAYGSNLELLNQYKKQKENKEKNK